MFFKDVLHRTGYKIKDDRKFLGTFIMSYNAFVTHIFRYMMDSKAVRAASVKHTLVAHCNV